MSQTHSTTLGNESSLSDMPEEVLPGVRAWRNSGNGFVGVLLHYEADPSGASEEQRKEGLSEDQFKREHGLSFSTWAGKAVYPMFSESSIAPVFPDTERVLPIWRGWDFGFHRPAVVWVQIHGGFWVLGEVLGEDMTLYEFLDRVVLPYQKAVFGDHNYFIDAADPAGMQVSDKSEHTSFALLSNRGIFPMQQRAEINKGLTIIRQKMVTGEFKIHPRCRNLIEGLKGGYRYPEPTKGTPEPQFPKKDGYYDHLQDALRYVAVNAVSVYERKEKPKSEKTREEKIYEKHRKGNQYRDRDLGDYI